MRKQFFFWILLAAVIVTLIAAPTQETARTRLADGFDFPVGKPNAEGYYKARGFRPNGHLGEDWNGSGGGNSDLGDPVYSIAHGMVMLAQDMRSGWGNSVIIRHIYNDGGTYKTIDSMYTHLDRIAVSKGQQVSRGDLIGTIGTNRGMYTAHLHFEIRKNLNIGMNRSAFKRDFSNYYSPTDFIVPRRQTKSDGRNVLIAVNTFDDKRVFDGSKKDTSGVSTAKNDSRSRAEDVRPENKRKSNFRVDRFESVNSF